MEPEPIGKTLRRLERYVYNLKAARELNMLSSRERDIMLDLRESITAARVAYNDSLSAEEAREIIKETETAMEKLEIVREQMLSASQYDLMTTVDVAQLSALNEHIYEKLKKILSE